MYAERFYDLAESAELIINEPDPDGGRPARVWIFRNYLSREEADSFYQHLIDTVDWEHLRGKTWNKEYDVPRLTKHMGDVSQSYNSAYSKIRSDWDPKIKELANGINQVYGTKFNSALINYYRDKNDYIAYHADGEVHGPNYFVFGLSLGQARPFFFKHKETGKVTELEVRSGDFMIMEGATQKLYKHSVPRRTAKNLDWKGRMSITFREL